ncbi:MAG: PKD domain-containing protein, partial [Bacteroidota bacterium]
YTLTVTDPATGCRASDDIRISVSPPINLTVNSGTICPGQPLQLTASGANAYSWSPATGLSSTSGAVVTANPSSTTSYTVTGTNTTTNCQATATATVTVQPSVAITGRSVSPVGCVSTNGTIILSGLSPNTNYTVNYDRNSVAQSSQTLTSAANGEISIGGLGTGTYSNIRVTINGCGSNTVGPFTINSPVPDKPVLSSQQITLCEGVATGAISFTAASGAIIRWTNSVPAIGLAANGTGNIASFNTVNNTGTTLQADVKVVADLNGCISAEETLRITVYPKVLLTVNSPTICPGTSVQLIASGANSYTWSPAAGLSSTTGASVNATPAATTTYTVTGTNTATNCQVSANATVTVQPLVAIAGRFISPVGCIGTGGIIILSGLNPNTTYTVNYERNSVSQNPQTLTSGVNGEISIGGLGTGTYTNIRVASNGCLSNAVGPYTFTSPVPDKPVLSAQQLTFCEGAATGNISFTTASGTIVRWTNSIPAIGLAANGTGDIVSFNTVNNTGTTLQAEIKVAAEQNGCRSIEEVLRITVYPKIMLNVNPASICPGASVQLTASGANNYTWSPAVGLNSTTGSVVTANPVATTTYTITGTNTATNCQAIAQTTVIVLPLPDPLLSVSGNSPNICEGSFVLLTANGGVNYQWYLNNQPISGATNSSYQATQPGSYSVEATNTQGCKNFSANKPVLQLLKKPKASFSVQAVCLGRPLLVTDLSVTNQSGPVSYLWDLGDGSSSTNSLPLHTYNKGGFFTVKLKVFSLNCPNLIDSFSSLVLVDTPRAGIRYPTISTLINTNTNLKARNFGTSYLWQPSQGLSRVNVFNPVFNYDKETDYMIRIGTPSGCITYDSVLVRVFSNSDVLVPTGFTPNRDGVNDFLDVYTIGIRKIHFWVFNRWGQLMFETTDPAQRWDGNFQGKPQPLENYVWIVEAESVSGQIIRKRGQTILIR